MCANVPSVYCFILSTWIDLGANVQFTILALLLLSLYGKEVERISFNIYAYARTTLVPHLLTLFFRYQPRTITCVKERSRKMFFCPRILGFSISILVPGVNRSSGRVRTTVPWLFHILTYTRWRFLKWFPIFLVGSRGPQSNPFNWRQCWRQNVKILLIIFWLSWIWSRHCLIILREWFIFFFASFWNCLPL